MSAPSPVAWEQQRERSSALMLRLIVAVARHLGRPIARAALVPSVAWFLLTAHAQRAASRRYLARVLGRPPGLWQLARHFHTFASCMLDRVFLLAGRYAGLRVQVERAPRAYEITGSGQGCLLLLAHLGSFEAVRVPGATERRLPLRVVMDRAHGQRFTALMEALNPAFAAQVLDATQPGPQLVLRMKEAIVAGQIVCLMADRVRGSEPAVEVTLLGGRARLPASPWLLASALGVPVVLGFGLYRGGGRYHTTIEDFAERIVLDRRDRLGAVREHAQRYAARLEARTREAPYNWFNFYDYWIDDAAPH